MNSSEKHFMRPKKFSRKRREDKEFDERLIEVSRVSRVSKGGRRIRFRTLVVVGDKKGRIGMGIARANEVSEAVKKATNHAKKNVFTVPIFEGTIPHEVISKYGAAKILLKPASKGTSIVAGGAVRVVVELAGISNILSKILGSRNKINCVYATMQALKSFNPRVVEGIKQKVSEKDASSIEPKEDKVVDKKINKNDK